MRIPFIFFLFICEISISQTFNRDGTRKPVVKTPVPMVDRQDTIDSKVKYGFGFGIERVPGTSIGRDVFFTKRNYDFPAPNIIAFMIIPSKKRELKKRRKENIINVTYLERKGEFEYYNYATSGNYGWSGNFKYSAFNLSFQRLSCPFKYPRFKFGYGIFYGYKFNITGTTYKWDFSPYRSESAYIPTREAITKYHIGMNLHVGYRLRLLNDRYIDVSLKQFIENSDFGATPNLAATLHLAYILW